MATADEQLRTKSAKFELGAVDVGALRRAKEEGRSGGAIVSAADAGADRGPAEAQTRAWEGVAPRSESRWARVVEASVYRPAAWALARTDIRFLMSGFPHRIGHLASEIDFLLKEIELGKRPKMRPVFVLPKGKAANEALLDVWRQKVRIVTNPFVARLLAPLLKHQNITHFLTEPFLAYDKASPYPGLLAEWGDRPPLVELPGRMRDAARSALARWGMREDGWWVCVHNREPGYSPEDEAIHRHRNANIDSFRLAMEEIVAQGGFVVRMGDPSMKPLAKIEGVYDYAHSDERAPALDVALAAECRFFLGTTSGLASVATMFNRPCAMTNTVPAGVAPGHGPRDVSILKLHKDERGRTYRFSEIFRHGVSRWRSAEAFRNARIRVEANAPEDIRDLVLEMIERDEGRFQPTEDDVILQRTFKSFLCPSDYSYGSGANVGRAFLRKYAMYL